MIIGGKKFDVLVVVNPIGETIAMVTDEQIVETDACKVYLAQESQIAFSEVYVNGKVTLFLEPNGGGKIDADGQAL